MIRFGFTLIFVLVYVLALGACSSVRLVDGPAKGLDRETETYRYFGFVEVIVPKADRDVEAFKIQSAGVALENGLSIGWREREVVLVPLKVNEDGSTPDEATCSLVVIIRSEMEARQAAAMLQGLEGDTLCKVEFQ